MPEFTRPVSPRLTWSRRRLLGAALAGCNSAWLAACGGGGAAAQTSGGSSSSGGSTSGAGVTDPWIWAQAGTSTTATPPTLADFVTVIASGSVDYAFHAAAVSTTTDPITSAVADTSARATLAPYALSRYLVTNANWKAFCNAKGESYYPSTARTSGQYWSGGSYPAGKENHPVFFVSCTAAMAYCAWLETQIPGYHFYVPTEGEWEYAALGSHSDYSYPWGSSAGISYDASSGTLSSRFNSNAVCTQFVLRSSGLALLTYANDSVVTTLSDGVTPLQNDSAALASVLSMNSSGGVAGWQYDGSANSSWADFANSDQFRVLVNIYGGYSSAVGAYDSGKSWCGIQDMAGNAYEWTSTLNMASNGAEAGQAVNCVKGGSWYATASSGKSSGRGEGRAAAGAYHSVGFRVASRPR